MKPEEPCNLCAEFDFVVFVTFDDSLSEDVCNQYLKTISNVLKRLNDFACARRDDLSCYNHIFLFDFKIMSKDNFCCNPIVLFDFKNMSKDNAICLAKHFKEQFTNEFILSFLYDEELFYV